MLPRLWVYIEIQKTERNMQWIYREIKKNIHQDDETSRDLRIGLDNNQTAEGLGTFFEIIQKLEDKIFYKKWVNEDFVEEFNSTLNEKFNTKTMLVRIRRNRSNERPNQEAT